MLLGLRSLSADGVRVPSSPKLLSCLQTEYQFYCFALFRLLQINQQSARKSCCVKRWLELENHFCCNFANWMMQGKALTNSRALMNLHSIGAHNVSAASCTRLNFPRNRMTVLCMVSLCMSPVHTHLPQFFHMGCQAHPRRVAKVQSQIQREISDMLHYDSVSAVDAGPCEPYFVLGFRCFQRGLTGGSGTDNLI